MSFIEQVQHWDDQVFLKVFSASERKPSRRFFYAVSRSADGPWYVFLAAAWVVFKPSTAVIWVLSAFIAFVVDISLYYVIKKNIGRPRPFRNLGVRHLIAPPDEFSFPSGHTAAAFLIATLVSFSFPILALPVLIWAALVGFSRIYLGVHYLTDVLAGMLLGVFSACLGAGIIGL